MSMSSHGRLNRRVRRLGDDARVELTPMIDVVFLLLTFFVFSIVLMVRADVLDVRLPELTAGQPAERVTPITISVNEAGEVVINREPTPLDQVVERVLAMRETQPDAPLLLAVDVRTEVGIVFELMDALVAADLRDFSFIGREAEPESEPLVPDQP